jgi:protein-S-isoprenylcysteine O-methyltransferase Ste14
MTLRTGISVGRALVWSGLVFLVCGACLSTYGVASVETTHCSVPPGVGSSGCEWSSLPGYLVVLGVFTLLIGGLFAIAGWRALKRDRRDPSSPSGTRE